MFPADIGDSRLIPRQVLTSTPVQFVQYSSNLAIVVTIRHLANQFDIRDVGCFANRRSWFFRRAVQESVSREKNRSSRHAHPGSRIAVRVPFEPGKRRATINEELNHIAPMSDQDREAYLKSDEFRGKYSAREQQMLTHLTEITPHP